MVRWQNAELESREVTNRRAGGDNAAKRAEKFEPR